MAKGRKNGCPVNIKNWLIYIQDKSQSEETWLRIYGLESMTYTTDGETEDGSTMNEDWQEPYVNKRSGSLSLEGKPVIAEATGERDEGQAMLNEYALLVGCDADATLKIVDPYGHAMVADFIVTSHEESADDTEDSESWDLEQVGEAETALYIQLTDVSLKKGSTAVTTLSVAAGASEIITVIFAPENASNKRFKVTNTKRSVASVSAITENSFTVTGVNAGTSTITVKSVNNALTATLAVTVTAAT